MNTQETAEFQTFLAAYMASLLWSSIDEKDGETVNLDEFELSTAGAARCRADCLAFFEANREDLKQAARDYKGADSMLGGYAIAGHDFALTRNGHGAGYWDGDLPESLGERLSAACEAVGQCEVYLGDDDEVYIQ